MRRLLPFIGFVVLVMICFLLWQWSMPLPEPTPTAVPATAEPTSTMASYPTGSYTATPTGTAVPPTATISPTDTPEPTATATLVATLMSPPTETATAVPTLEPEPTAVELPEFYVVKKDDWLIRIAMRLYNSPYGWEWQCLYQHNRDVIGENPHLIYRGMVLGGIRPCGGQP